MERNAQQGKKVREREWKREEENGRTEDETVEHFGNVSVYWLAKAMEVEVGRKMEGKRPWLK